MYWTHYGPVWACRSLEACCFVYEEFFCRILQTASCYTVSSGFMDASVLRFPHNSGLNLHNRTIIPFLFHSAASSRSQNRAEQRSQHTLRFCTVKIQRAADLKKKIEIKIWQSWMGLIFSVPSLALKPSLSSAAILLRRRKKWEECGPAPLIDYDVVWLCLQWDYATISVTRT